MGTTTPSWTAPVGGGVAFGAVVGSGIVSTTCTLQAQSWGDGQQAHRRAALSRALENHAAMTGLQDEDHHTKKRVYLVASLICLIVAVIWSVARRYVEGLGLAALAAAFALLYLRKS